MLIQLATYSTLVTLSTNGEDLVASDVGLWEVVIHGEGAAAVRQQAWLRTGRSARNPETIRLGVVDEDTIEVFVRQHVRCSFWAALPRQAVAVSRRWLGVAHLCGRSIRGGQIKPALGAWMGNVTVLIPTNQNDVPVHECPLPCVHLTAVHRSIMHDPL